jgi:hypothetical protein
MEPVNYQATTRLDRTPPLKVKFSYMRTPLGTIRRPPLVLDAGFDLEPGTKIERSNTVLLSVIVMKIDLYYNSHLNQTLERYQTNGSSARRVGVGHVPGPPSRTERVMSPTSTRIG